MSMAGAGSAPDTTNPAVAQVVLANKTEELVTLSQWISDVASEYDLPGKTVFALDLALTEAVTNVLSYAFVDDERHEVEISIAITEAAVTAKITDDGQPFDPLKTKPAQRPASLDEAGVGGLGIHLIRNYASACRYRRENGHNILTLTFNLAHA
jgi:anti-sigma regulatory factor (Ser/Thr protein kinase)